MIECFFANIYLCFLPAHTSHGLQPLDNGVFNSVKTAYRKDLSHLESLTNSAPVNKINFIRCDAAARRAGMTKQNIQSGFITTGNLPVSRAKALNHPECMPDGEDREGTPEPGSGNESTPEDQRAPTTARQIMDMGKNESPAIRLKLRKVAQAFHKQLIEMVMRDQKIATLEAEIERLRPKKRRKVPNPNRKFMKISEILASGGDPTIEVIDQRDGGGEVVVEPEEEGVAESSSDEEPEIRAPVVTRSGRSIQKPSRYNN